MLFERRARADRELVEPDRLVGLLEAVDERAALDRRAAPDRVDPPVGEYGSVGQVNFGYLEAGAVIAMIPCVLLYIGLQRFYIRGLVSGV